MTSTSAKPSMSTSSTNHPDLLSVPSISLTTGLKPEGLRGGQVNPLPGETIWFTGYGRVIPGALGTAVIAGHVADGKKPDIFANLIKVKQGSTFDLTMVDGSTQKFSVKRAQVVSKQALRHDQEVWGANTSTARVVLITCDDELGFGADGHRKANYVVVGESVK